MNCEQNEEIIIEVGELKGVTPIYPLFQTIGGFSFEFGILMEKAFGYLKVRGQGQVNGDGLEPF
jgi:hypothetical protein